MVASLKIFIASRRGHYQNKRCLNKKLCTCFHPITTGGTKYVISAVLNVTFRELKETLLGGGGTGEVQKKYSRKGKLNEKKFHARQLTLKNIHATA